MPPAFSIVNLLYRQECKSWEIMIGAESCVLNVSSIFQTSEKTPENISCKVSAAVDYECLSLSLLLLKLVCPCFRALDLHRFNADNFADLLLCFFSGFNSDLVALFQ